MQRKFEKCSVYINYHNTYKCNWMKLRSKGTTCEVGCATCDLSADFNGDLVRSCSSGPKGHSLRLVLFARYTCYLGTVCLDCLLLSRSHHVWPRRWVIYRAILPLQIVHREEASRRQIGWWWLWQWLLQHSARFCTKNSTSGGLESFACLIHKKYLAH